MDREVHSTEKFVARVFGTAAVNDVINNYRVAPDRLSQIIIDSMRDMGIFKIHPQHQRFFVKFIVDRLKNDRKILNLVQMARLREQTRTRSRHAD